MLYSGGYLVKWTRLLNSIGSFVQHGTLALCSHHASLVLPGAHSAAALCGAQRGTSLPRAPLLGSFLVRVERNFAPV
jgi:hypothetical protein